MRSIITPVDSWGPALAEFRLETAQVHSQNGTKMAGRLDIDGNGRRVNYPHPTPMGVNIDNDINRQPTPMTVNVDNEITRHPTPMSVNVEKDITHHPTPVSVNIDNEITRF